MATEKRMFNENRCRIINFILENPGEHFSSIMRELDLTKRGLGYHLEILVEEGLIDAKPLGIFKFYYPAGYEETKRKLTPMQQEIVDLMREATRTVEEIGDILEKTPMAIQYHLKNLLLMGIIRRDDIGNNILYRYVVDEI